MIKAILPFLLLAAPVAAQAQTYYNPSSGRTEYGYSGQRYQYNNSPVYGGYESGGASRDCYHSPVFGFTCN